MIAIAIALSTTSSASKLNLNKFTPTTPTEDLALTTALGHAATALVFVAAAQSNYDAQRRALQYGERFGGSYLRRTTNDVTTTNRNGGPFSKRLVRGGDGGLLDRCDGRVPIHRLEHAVDGVSRYRRAVVDLSAKSGTDTYYYYDRVAMWACYFYVQPEKEEEEEEEEA